ncbi:MAG: winged helix DNA-binding protein [Gammaproteobacteria bacterium]|nr:winged helix DNA-binding protein [Gammaproteobacteria bacterium]
MADTPTAHVKLDDAHYRNWHLARDEHGAVTTDFEWSVLRFQQAFERYVMQLAAVCGMPELSFPEIVILHVIRMQERPKTAAVIARQINRDDIPNIQYSLRKLVKLKLARKVRESGGKIFAYDVTKRGRLVLDRYADLRNEVLTQQMTNIEDIGRKLRDTARLLSLLTGLYDEAGRVSASYSTVTTAGDTTDGED